MGYRTWKLQSISDETKQVVWNPELDVVFCGESWQILVGVYTPSIAFSHQFPPETTLVRYLALPSSQWVRRHSQNGLRFNGGCFMNFKNLREICVVVDIPLEYTWAVGFKKNRVDTNRIPFLLPDAIKDDCVREKNLWPDSGWKVPTIKAVTCEKDILRAETKRLVLRCRPCKDMHDILHTDSAKELIEAAPDNITLLGLARMNHYPPEWFLS